MSISSPGIGSNLNVTDIVTKLMSTEQGPLTALATKEASYQAKLSGLGSLKGAISTLQSAAAALVADANAPALKKFSVFNAALGDSSIGSASASSGASSGNYKLEVKQLAERNTIATSTTATPFSAVGGLLATGGTLTITLDTRSPSGTPIKSTEVSIADGSSPEAVRDAINAANAGVTASVITGTQGKQLVITGDTTGANQFIKLSGIAALDYDPSTTPAPLTDAFTEAQAALDSTIKLNGITITNTSNTVTGAIEGVTLNLARTTETDKPTTIAVTRDISSLTSGLNALIKAFNDVMSTADSLGGYNVTTKVAGVLNGESSLRSAQSILRSVLGNRPSGLDDAKLRSLSDIGVGIQKNGTLGVDSKKLASLIGSDLSGVSELVSAFGSAFKVATDGLVGTNGTIVARTSGINSSIEAIGKQRELVNARLVTIEARYRKQFTALDTLMSNMTSTSNYLTTQLANLSSLTLSKS